MPENGGVDHVRILRMDADARNMAPLFEPNVRPGLTRVGGFPHAVAVRHVAADGFFAGADVDHVRVGVADGDGADRAAEEAVGNVLPGGAAVGRAPDAAAGRAEVE